MLTPITVRIPGEPVAQGRPRAFTPPGGHTRLYDPPKSRRWKTYATEIMVAALGGAPDVAFIEGPLTVDVRAVFTCPKSDWSRRAPRKRRWHAKRPDAENVAKAVLDAGKGILWTDDAQVARLLVDKIIGAQGEAPYVEITVSPVEGA